MHRFAPDPFTAEAAYEDFFGLQGRPFAGLPDIETLYWSETHRLGADALSFAVARHVPVALLTGAAGTGKSTLIRHFTHHLDARFRVVLMNHVLPGAGSIVPWMLSAFGARASEAETAAERLVRLQQMIIDTYAAGKSTVLVFDEAHNLDNRQLDELRMLLAMNGDQDELVQLILIGQPLLRDRLQDPALGRFAQWIGADHHLMPLEPGETPAFIQQRLELAGARAPIFQPGAAATVHRLSGGVPRLINVLCNICLASASTVGRVSIDDTLVSQTLQGLNRRGVFSHFTRTDESPVLMNARG